MKDVILRNTVVAVGPNEYQAEVYISIIRVMPNGASKLAASTKNRVVSRGHTSREAAYDAGAEWVEKTLFPILTKLPAKLESDKGRLHDCAFCKFGRENEGSAALWGVYHSVKPEIIIDGRTSRGSWAWMCEGHHADLGVGLGTGKGQKFRQHNDTLTKLEG